MADMTLDELKAAVHAGRGHDWPVDECGSCDDRAFRTLETLGFAKAGNLSVASEPTTEAARLREAVETEWYNGNITEAAYERIIGIETEARPPQGQPGEIEPNTLEFVRIAREVGRAERVGLGELYATHPKGEYGQGWNDAINAVRAALIRQEASRG